MKGQHYNVQLEASVIAADMVIEGDIRTGGDLTVLGAVTGNVDISGTLIVDGCITGDIHSSIFSAGTGKVTGNITADDGVAVERDAIIMGNISGENIAINGAVKGNIDARKNLSLGGTSKVKGEIRCATMVMESGASIDGARTLCYSGNSSEQFDSFFDRLEHPENYPVDDATEGGDLANAAEIAEAVEEELAQTTFDGDDASLDFEVDRFIRNVDGEEVPADDAGKGSKVTFITEDFVNNMPLSDDSLGFEKAASM